MPVTDVQKDFDALTIKLVAQFDAPVDRIWEAWSDPRQLERWWGPPSHPATFTEHDLTPGGLVAYYMTGPDGQKIHGWWRIEEVEPPHLLRFRDADAEGQANEEAPTTTAGSAILTMAITLAEADGRTTMAIESHCASREGMEEVLEMGYEQGSREALDQLDALLAS
ncbi:MAG TPA: SRPBCC domain-containing protein [Solirubrobacterales bacterium]|jgi:uncharacterized protein YndB with AHSA1/START domain